MNSLIISSIRWIGLSVPAKSTLITLIPSNISSLIEGYIIGLIAVLIWVATSSNELALTICPQTSPFGLTPKYKTPLPHVYLKCHKYHPSHL
nr:hypothetical protein [Mycoplasmopsis arginini]